MYPRPPVVALWRVVEAEHFAMKDLLRRVAPPAGDFAMVDRLLSLPRYPLGQWPTPLTSAVWNGCELLVKRDDLSGWQRGGAKTRKIEHLLGWMLASGYDSLVTFAGNVTNLAFDLVPAAEQAGVQLVLLVVDDPPVAEEDRHTIFAGLEGAGLEGTGLEGRVRLLGSSRVAASAIAAQALLAERRRGRRPLLVLPGGCHPAAIAGNAVGFLEMVTQCLAEGEKLPDEVVVPTATGNTLAGFHIGAEALRATGVGRIRISGAQVYPGPISASGRFLRLWTRRWLGSERPAHADGMTVWRGGLQGGFGRFDEDLRGLCHRVLDTTSLPLDPIFGGKAWRLLEQRLRAEPQRRFLYWHCGFTPEWAALGRFVDAGQGRP